MKRDDDYIRQILIELEESDKHIMIAALTLSAPSEQLKKHYHAELLCDAGLFLAVNDGVYRLSNKGHDYLNVIRDDNAWKKVKAGARAVGGITLQMMADLAVAYAKAKLQKVTGLQL